MKNPEIAIKWGGKWPKEAKTVVDVPIRAALNMANDGLEELGLFYKRPKIAIMRRVPKAYNTSGQAIDARRFELCFEPKEINRNQVQKRIKGNARVAAHELTHCLRWEYYDEDTLLEYAASEGLANCVVDLLAVERLGTPYYKDVRERVARIDASGLHKKFLKLVAGDTENTSKVCRQWADRFIAGHSDINPLTIIGVGAINEHLEAGATISDLLPLPAAELLGIEAA